MQFLKTIAALSAVAGMGLATVPANANEVTTQAAGTPGGINLSSMGVQAPGLDIGTEAVKAGTLQYSNSGGTSDAFSVGTSTSISASASASSTPDYDVTSNANFGINLSTINQVIGTSSNSNNTTSSGSSSSVDYGAKQSAELSVSRNYKREHNGVSGPHRRNKQTNQWEVVNEVDYTNERSAEYDVEYERAYSNINSKMDGLGTISGAFAKTSDTTDSSNNVTVKGIGADNKIAADDASVFSSKIQKGAIPNSGVNIDSTTNTNISGAAATGTGTDSDGNGGTGTGVAGTGSASGTVTSSSAGTASGSAAGNVSTTASANASSTQFVSSFVQAY
jgi:hypothetical protein